MSDPIHHFSGRVADYAAARPGYPDALIDEVLALLEIPPGATIADVGSGTGLLSVRLLHRGFSVIGVEPNEAMRTAAEAQLSQEAQFRSIAGRAESTGLADASVDAIVAAQAFHWFEPAATRCEFARICRGRAPIALIWNVRDTRADAFHVKLEELLISQCPTYRGTAAGHGDAAEVGRFFAPAGVERRVAPHEVLHDRDGFWKRLSSASYVVTDGAAGERFRAAALQLFDAHAQDGRIRLKYDATAFCGFLRP